jgi:glucan phosphoethanolaminetransferase (alkaline phosphatase superfamily)
MPDAQPIQPTPSERKVDRQLLGSMAISVFAAAFEVVIGFSVAHWVAVTNSKTWGYVVTSLAFGLCLVAGWMAFDVRARLTGRDDTRPGQERQLFMANLDLLAAGLVVLLIFAGTVVLITLRPNS